MYEPLQISKCEKFGKVIAEPKELIESQNPDVAKYLRDCRLFWDSIEDTSNNKYQKHKQCIDAHESEDGITGDTLLIAIRGFFSSHVSSFQYCVGYTRQLE